jgi:hypothetical protein
VECRVECCVRCIKRKVIEQTGWRQKGSKVRSAIDIERKVVEEGGMISKRA